MTRKVAGVDEAPGFDRDLAAISTEAHILALHELVKPSWRERRTRPGCPQTKAAKPNDIWPADYEGQFCSPAQFLVHSVRRAGTIGMFRNRVFVSSTLHACHLGLEEVDDGVYELYLCFCRIGRYELRTNQNDGIVSDVELSVNWVNFVGMV